MSLRSPLSQARGLGSAKDGVGHWWMQRMTAIALIPLSLWFVFSLVRFPLLDHATMVAWIHAPLVAVALVLFFLAMFYHAALGVQVVIEDYVGNEGVKLVSIVVTKFALFAFGAAAIFAVLKIAFGA
ncbi:succinate dehydrogenase, hydrophobic membrane anchor protein [Nevskia ramosa]|uniref:succinate dehydrogenase, hydrophobic membrane anchor protein n=1 Tax=Nevskia ramosa TaxID=64002 RepID=UPI0003B5076E|nr:succinate dehydrogenase, hydrophobic membrane anchor protein [Nevskia ramosa]MDP3294024.1 succinate dehydrogenase, hydrophobic membrane anchor protein [Nevskia sp.]